MSFPGVKSGRGVTLTPHPLLVPWSRKSRAILLLPLWSVPPVQSLSACARAHFTLPYCKRCKQKLRAFTNVCYLVARSNTVIHKYQCYYLAFMLCSQLVARIAYDITSVQYAIFTHSFANLLHKSSVATYQAGSPHNEIWCFLSQFPISCRFLKAIQ